MYFCFVYCNTHFPNIMRLLFSSSSFKWEQISRCCTQLGKIEYCNAWIFCQEMRNVIKSLLHQRSTSFGLRLPLHVSNAGSEGKPVGWQCSIKYTFFQHLQTYGIRKKLKCEVSTQLVILHTDFSAISGRLF